MRNALVVLVFSCIGLSFGFIIPSGVLELVDETQALLAENTVKESEEIKTTTLQDDTGFIIVPYEAEENEPIDLETIQNRIKDKELYEQSTGKQNNVNERSFIYINQKFKTPAMNQLYSSADLLKGNENQHFNRYPERYPLAYIKPKKEYFDSKIQQKTPSPSFYFPTVFKYGHNTGHQVVDDKQNVHDIVKATANKIVDLPRDYIELLKPPLVRPTNVDVQKEKLRWQNILPAYNNFQGKDPNVQRYPIDRRTDALPFVNPMISYKTDHYGFATPYEQKSNSELNNYKPEEYNVINNNNFKKLINDNNEVNNLIHRYMENTLENQVTKEHTDTNINCNFKNCVVKPRKQFVNSHIGDNNCKCRRRMNLQLRESKNYEPNTTTYENVGRMTTETNIISNSSEISEYGELFTDEANLKRLLEK